MLRKQTLQQGRALVISEPNNVELKEVSLPDLKEGEVLIRVKYCCICSSDLRILEGTILDQKYPIVPGHEWSGEVIKATTKYERLVGKRVVANTLQPCLECPSCRKGMHNLCQNLSEIGFTLNGAWADYLIVQGRNIVVLPDNISLKDASFTEILVVFLLFLYARARS